MNYSVVARQLGLLLFILSGALLLVAMWSFVDWWAGDAGELHALRALGLSVVIGFGSGWVFWQLGQGRDEFFGRREALLLVAAAWLVGAALSALPFWMWGLLHTGAVAPDGQPHPFTSIINCYFESVSGLTTTGSSILTDIEALPRGILLWRSTTHWLGGIGIVVLFVAVLPTLGVGGRVLFGFESSAQASELRPRIRQTARVLWLVYAGMSLVQFLLLKLCGLSWFDSICETFGTMASGGFSTKNASIAAYDSLAAEIVIMVFMMLTGVNFALYIKLFRKRWSIWTDPELRFYLALTVIGCLVVSYALVGRTITLSTGDTVPGTIANAFRHGCFQVISIRSNTGYATADSNLWPFASFVVLWVLMLMGASAGSTAGGIKMIRCLLALRILGVEIERTFRPNVVRPIKLAGVVDPQMRLTALVFIVTYLGLVFVGSLLVMAFEAGSNIDYVTAASACSATITNTGPGFGAVGSVANFGWMTPGSKLVLCLLMVTGRLEMYAILALFYWRFWLRD